MKIEKIDLSVAFLAGVSMIGTLWGFPIWSLFISWAWYFALINSEFKDKVFSTAVPTMTITSCLSMIAIFSIGALGDIIGGFWAGIIVVTVTVFAIMCVLKIKRCNFSLVAFNAYSCMFVGWGAESARINELAGTTVGSETLATYGMAFLWITGANFVGLLFGWASVKLASIGEPVNVEAEIEAEVEEEKAEAETA